MRRIVINLAFSLICLSLLISCQSNQVNHNTTEPISSSELAPDTPKFEIIETTESTEMPLAETIEVETEVSAQVKLADEEVMVLDAIITPENNKVTFDKITLETQEEQVVAIKVHNVAIEHIEYNELKAVTPLFKIDANSCFFENPVVLTYPHDASDSSHYFAFFYDVNEDSLEMLPYSRGETYTEFYTHHFSNIFIAQMSPETLMRIKSSSDCVTPFKVGVDDFRFANYGSYAAPEGHCDGQSQAAMWYFKNIRLKNLGDSNSALHTLYDNNLNDFRTPNFWQDDSWLYRFASSVQRENTSGYMFGLLHMDTDIFPENNVNRDQQTFDAFYLSMHLTNRPQLIWIWSEDGESGHAMIVYAIRGDKMYIADPNYPGIERIIEIENGQFKPYNSAINAAEIESGKGTSYTQFQYLGEFATIDEQKIASHWNSVVTAQLSNAYFPYFQVISKSGNVCAGSYEFYIEPTDQGLDDFVFYVYNQSLEKLPLFESTGLSYATSPYEVSGLNNIHYILEPLESGDNTIGILIGGRKKASESYNWAGFQWLTIFNDTNLMLEAEKTSIKPGETVIINAKMESGLDVEDKLIWLYDGEETEYYTNTFTFESDEIGEYVVEAMLQDSNISASITIEVTESPIEPVAEIPLSEREKVSGTYSCSFSLSSFEAKPFTKFWEDPWYTAEQLSEIASGNASRLQDAYSEKMGIITVDRDNFRVNIHEDGNCTINFSDFLGVNMAFYSVGPVPFNGGNVAFETKSEGKEYSGIIQFEIDEKGVSMSGNIKRILKDNQNLCYLISGYTFEGKKID